MNITLTQEQIDAYNYFLENDHRTPNVNLSIEVYAQRALASAFNDFIKKKKSDDLDSIKEITDALLKANPTKRDQIKDILNIEKVDEIIIEK